MEGTDGLLWNGGDGSDGEVPKKLPSKKSTVWWFESSRQMLMMFQWSVWDRKMKTQ